MPQPAPAASEYRASSAGNLVGADRCLFDLGFDLSSHPLRRRNHATFFDGRGSLHRLRRLSLRAAPFQR